MSGKAQAPVDSPRSKETAAAAQNAPAAASQRLVSFVKNIFAKKQEQQVVISGPFDVSHDHHVEFDEETGFTVRKFLFMLTKVVFNQF